MSGGRCVKHDNWHAECWRCLEEGAYERGVAEGERRERAAVVAVVRAWLHGDGGLVALKEILERIEAGEHEDGA